MHVKCASFAELCIWIHAFLFDCVVYCNKRLFLYKKSDNIVFIL